MVSRGTRQGDVLNSSLFYSVLQFVKARQLKPVDICCLPLLFDCVTVPRRNFCREPRCGDHQPGTRRARLKRAKARRLLRAHHGSAPPMSKTWEFDKCGRNNPPHSWKCQTWNCRERGPGQEDGGYCDWLWRRVQFCPTIEMPFMWSCTWSVSATTGAERSQAPV